METRTPHPPAGSDQAREHIQPGEARTVMRRATDASHDPAGSRATSGSRAAGGGRGPGGSPARVAEPHAPDHGTLRLTARGAALAMFSIIFPGTLTSGWLHFPVLSGASFVAACVVAALATRREDLLVVVTLPPVVFLASAICVAAVSSDGGGVLAGVSGIALTLGRAALWLLAGEGIVLVLSLFRGLHRCVRDLRTDLRGESY
ncbi:MAG TPA: DUF6542 domain-containing protein [Pseudonocardiaceae bacterium]